MVRRLTDNQLRGVIGVTLLVLLCVGLGVFCAVYLTNKDTSEPTTSDTSDTTTAASHRHRQTTTSEKRNEDSESSEDSSHEATTTETIDTGPEYRIRLNQNDNSSSGIVYVQTDEREGFVCTDGYDVNAATVTCRELGFKHGLPYNNRVSFYPYNRYILDQPILSNLNCTGSEQKLSECGGFRLDNETDCTWFTSVACYNEDEPYELRLVNGSYPDSGLVEMRLGDQWGVFCGIRTFDDEVADILCRNMNYTGGLTIERGELGAVPTDVKIWAPFIFCNSDFEIKQLIFDCNLTLHPENVLYDHVEFRNNRYRSEYFACVGENSHAAAVQCLKLQ